MTNGNNTISGRPNEKFEEGLTKREYFAALAMQGLVSKYNLNSPKDQQIVSQLSVELAGELINELNK